MHELVEMENIMSLVRRMHVHSYTCIRTYTKCARARRTVSTQLRSRDTFAVTCDIEASQYLVYTDLAGE